MENVYVKFGDASCIGFEISCGETDTQTNGDKKTLPPRLTSLKSSFLAYRLNRLLLSVEFIKIIAYNRCGPQPTIRFIKCYGPIQLQIGSAKRKKGKEAYLYSAFYILCISQSAQAWITQFYLQIHLPAFPSYAFTRWRHL